MKRCSCTRHYTHAEWDALPSLGLQDDGVEVLEYKNCQSCQSTMAVVIACHTSRHARETLVLESAREAA